MIATGQAIALLEFKRSRRGMRGPPSRRLRRVAMLVGNPFAEIALTLLVAALIGALGTWLRQPLIVPFIAVGLLVGPAGIGLFTQHEQIQLLASIGIAPLVFVVGLKPDFHTIRTLGSRGARDRK